jgi:hypothetical protein
MVNTRTIHSINGIEVNMGGGMARGLYNLSRDNHITLWFDEGTLDHLMSLSDEKLEQEFLKMVR